MLHGKPLVSSQRRQAARLAPAPPKHVPQHCRSRGNGRAHGLVGTYSSSSCLRDVTTVCSADATALLTFPNIPRLGSATAVALAGIVMADTKRGQAQKDALPDAEPVARLLNGIKGRATVRILTLHLFCPGISISNPNLGKIEHKPERTLRCEPFTADSRQRQMSVVCPWSLCVGRPQVRGSWCGRAVCRGRGCRSLSPAAATCMRARGPDASSPGRQAVAAEGHDGSAPSWPGVRGL